MKLSNVQMQRIQYASKRVKTSVFDNFMLNACMQLDVLSLE